jgi:hypothetical protein
VEQAANIEAQQKLAQAPKIIVKPQTPIEVETTPTGVPDGDSVNMLDF